MSSCYGNQLKLSVFGQSHAEAIGVVLDGLPAGEPIDLQELAGFMARRAPGAGALSTPRKEADAVRILCGLLDGVTCGAPLTVIIENTNTRSADYEKQRDIPRPSHADFTAQVKYHGWQDIRGGGHFSGRLTAPICAAGGICLQILRRRGVRIGAHVHSIAGFADAPLDPLCPDMEALRRAGERELPVLDPQAGFEMRRAILDAAADGDSVGGVVECAVTGFPAGIGDPIFDGLESRLSAMLFGIPAVRGVEFGAGFAAAGMRGSAHNDPFAVADGRIVTSANRHGGILGGISSGMPIIFRTAFKPTPSIAAEQDSVSLSRRAPEKLTVSGRHDPCIVPRAVPVVEAAAAAVLLDALLGGIPTETGGRYFE